MMSHSPLQRLIVQSIAAAVFTIGVKAAAYFITGSVGLLADALESGLNLVAAITAYFSLWYAARPIDPTHTYGHEKIEFFSAGLEGVLIVVAAIGIGFIAVKRLITPEPIDSIGLGALIALCAGAVNLVVGMALLRAGRRYRSIILQADGQHLLTDVVTSLGVVVGLCLVRLTGWYWVDPVVALLVAANITWTAYGVIETCFNGLMDHALTEQEQNQLRDAIRAALPEGTDFHALRTRRAGTRRFADFHLLLPGTMSVSTAHELSHSVEAHLQAAMPGMEVSIHLEPIECQTSFEDNVLAPFEAKNSEPTP